MKITKILFVIVISLLYCNTTRAGDLQILHEGTESLCFKITDVTNRTLEVITNKEFSNTQYTGDIIIPDTVYLFYDWDAIPYRVTSVGENAFSGCGEITSIEIPNSVISIGYRAFYDCSGLTNATIGNSVTSIGDYAFEYCSKLRTVINLSNLTFRNGSTNNGHIARYASKVINAPNGFIDSDYIWFENESGMTLAGYLGNATKLILPIEYNGKSITNIGDYAFYSCTGLTSVTIPNSVTSIGNYAFYGCGGITSITIPNSVTKIGNDAFRNCSALKTVVNFSLLTFNKNSDDYGEVTYYANKVINAPNGEFIDDFVFYTSDNENFLAGYIGNATELVLPENYKEGNYCIGDQAFSSYTTLTSVTIPNNVAGIGDYSFWRCVNITKITSLISADNLFAVGEYTFRDVDWKDGTLYVPYKAKEKYASTDGWKYFKNIVELRDTYKVTFCIDGKEVVAYDIKEGDSIVYPNEYGKEGYSLIWDTNIDIMPSYDITINGTFTVNSYTITYIVDGETFATDSITYGSEIILHDEPAKEGYTFSGWREIPETMPAKDITIEGSFTVNSYTVTFIVDGEIYKSISVEYGTEIPTVETPTKEGHTFSGWIDAPVTMHAKDITISGSFIVNSYNVQFVIDEDVYEIATVEYGTEITTPTVPEKEGYTFSGWREIPKTMPAKDIVVYGSYKVNYYKLIYIIENAVYMTSDVVFGSTIEPIDEPQKEGYNFNGWIGLPNTMPAKDITIEGSFTVNSYTVTFIVDGEIYKSISVEYGTEIPTVETPTKEGHTFSGWIEAPAIMPANNITIEGSFIVNSYNVIYKVYGKEYKTESVEYGTKLVLAEQPTKEGYTFSGWNEAPATMPAEDITIEGSFTVNSYTVQFVIDEDVYETATVEYDTEITTPTVPEKEGYTFSGWGNIPEIMPAKDIVVYGSYKVNYYKLIYIIENAVYMTSDVVFGSTIEPIDEPQKEGYNFNGWIGLPNTMPAKDITIEGSFTVNSYTVTFIVDGEIYKSISVEYGTEIPTVETPTKEGHTFSGWIEAPAIMPAEDITISGSFIVNSYTVQFVIDEDVYETATVEYNTEIATPTVPEKEGYTFSGWREIPKTMPAKDITIEGSFTVNSYTATFTVDGEVYKNISVEYGTETPTVETPTKEGHTFSGWIKTPVTMPAEDITIEGSFAVNSYNVQFVINEDVYETATVEYGTEITTPTVPEKEGYTFSGWREIPKTMPAKDIVVYGSYKVNYYKLIYIIENAVYMTSDVVFGSTIEPIDEPQKEGYSFNGWIGLPNTMPAKDIVIIGTFNVNSYTVTFMIDGEIYETATVEYGTEIPTVEAPTKKGHTFSGWNEVPAIMPAEDIIIQGSYIADTAIEDIYLDLEKNEIYNMKGLRITETDKLTRGIYIINGNKTYVK